MIRFSVDGIERNPQSVVTVGTFDGMHDAHQRILETLVAKTKAIGGRSVAITFKPHPQEVPRKERFGAVNDGGGPRGDHGGSRHRRDLSASF